MARGYGIGNFGDAYFGATKYVDVASSSTVSSGATGNAVGVFATDSLTSSQAVVTSVSVVTYSGVGLIYADSTVTSAGTRVREVSGTASSSASGICNIATVNNVPVSISALSASVCDYIRKRGVDVTIEPILTATINARYKYEPIAKDNESWAVVPQGNEIWTEVA